MIRGLANHRASGRRGCCPSLECKSHEHAALCELLNRSGIAALRLSFRITTSNAAGA
jgi:hypothetical protein